ncbi:uncharacterized protein LOC141648899 [Silene latifolia]|uniref:uncharacterized protein LOC141648899 n=1 Tax=Silene latifolia TaxID=37657 RepID=UPI003D76D134
MEYLSRVLEFVTQKWEFKYHPLCKGLRLNHLLFADDMLLFCKWDTTSIMLMLRAFPTFSATSGLKINVSKSEVIFAGVSDAVKQDILQISRFTEGVLPFRYLGLPIQAWRLTRQDCNILEEKVIARARGIGARKLSYAGRLTLINSMLNTLNNYWSSIFLISKMVINRIVAIYRTYLWDGGIEYQRAPLVAWDKVCCSKKLGVLGIKNAELWNIATIGKLVRWIYNKADRLWVQWIDHIYMKGAAWATYVPPADSNWNWRNICKVRVRMDAGYVNYSWMPDPKGYSVGSGYLWLQGMHPSVPWYSEIWDNWCVPKHSFIGWLIKYEALNTREILYKPHLAATECCVLCEKVVKLICIFFSECPYSKQIIERIEDWLHLKLDQGIIQGTVLQKHTCRMAKLACWYHIWLERNKCRIKMKLTRPDYIVKEIQKLVHARL